MKENHLNALIWQQIALVSDIRYKEAHAYVHTRYVKVFLLAFESSVNNVLSYSKRTVSYNNLLNQLETVVAKPFSQHYAAASPSIYEQKGELPIS